MLVPSLLLALGASPAEPELAPAVPPASTPTEPRRRPRPRPLGPVGSGGIVLGGAGMGVAIAGVVRMTQPDVPTSEPGNLEYITCMDTRIQGGILLGTGLAVAVAGATMLAVDLTVLPTAARPRPGPVAQVGRPGLAHPGLARSGRVRQHLCTSG